MFIKPTGRIDRRSPANEGKPEDPILRENWLVRDGVLKKPLGTERFISSGLTGRPTWMARYNTFEEGIESPKTICYTQNGKLWHLDYTDSSAQLIKSGLKLNAYPRHAYFKLGEHNYLYLVDGEKLFKHDGNNNHTFVEVAITDSDGNSVKPIGIIEHRDRLCVISNAYLFISANLQPDIFDDADDSIQIIIGSGKGRNLAVGKIEDNLYIFNTEGIFQLVGDTISALAATFEIALMDERKIIASGSLTKVEKALLFIADDLELWSWDGSSSQKLSHNEILSDFINPYRTALDKMVSTYEDNYYKLSFVETGRTENNLEIWWDAIENKIDFVRDRYVGCYLVIDPTIEIPFYQYGRSDQNYIMWAERGHSFDNSAIVSLLRTRDIIVREDRNVRFSEIFVELQPIGNRNFTFQYLLDGRLSDLDYKANFSQNMQGEVKTLGMITIKNQRQTLYRTRPKINYSLGRSIAFYIKDETVDLRIELLKVGFNFIDKSGKKGRKTGA